MDGASFSLADEPWIPVQGSLTDRLSIRAVFEHAGESTALIPGFPTQLPAILRHVLLPILLDAGVFARTTAEWGAMFEVGRFDAEQLKALNAYLDEHHDAFDLFGDNPFAQVAGLRTPKGETKTVAHLILPLAAGNNVPLFQAVTDADRLALEPAEAAMWLLNAHCWDTAAIKTGAEGDPQVKSGKTTGNRVGSLGAIGVVVPTGRTVFETLLLNLPILASGRTDFTGQGAAPGERDRPQWRSERTPEWTTRAPLGYMDLLTWMDRRIRLVAEETAAGVRVSEVVIAAGDRLAAVPREEPHTMWRRGDPKKSVIPYVPKRHTAGRTAWQGLDSLVAVGTGVEDASEVQTSILLKQILELLADEVLTPDFPLGVELVGLSYGTQSAVVDDLIVDSIPLPMRSLVANDTVHDAVLEVAGQTSAVERAINVCHADLRRAAGGDPVPWDKGQRPGSVFIHSIDPIIRHLLTEFSKGSTDADVEPLMLHWETQARELAKQAIEPLMRSASPSAFIGRETGGRRYRESTAVAGLHNQLRKVLWRVAAKDDDERRAAS